MRTGGRRYLNIILNEKAYAEHSIETGYISDKPTETLGILAKYYYVNGKSRVEIINLLDEFMNKNFENYNSDRWSNTIENQAIRAEKYQLKIVGSVQITEAELETIRKINNKVLEKLAFTFLCIAKFYNVVNSNNNDWANVEDKLVFKLANIQAGIVKQCLYINDLKRLGLIEYSKKVDNINTNVLYIDTESPVVLNIKEFKDLGNEYLYYCGEKFIRCCECNRLVKVSNPKNTSQRYCNDCKKEKDKDKKLKYYYKSKN